MGTCCGTPTAKQSPNETPDTEDRGSELTSNNRASRTSQVELYWNDDTSTENNTTTGTSTAPIAESSPKMYENISTADLRQILIEVQKYDVKGKEQFIRDWKAARGDTGRLSDIRVSLKSYDGDEDEPTYYAHDLEEWRYAIDAVAQETEINKKY
jgi:hypothetical protein